MSVASLFTAEVKRRINDYFPALGDRPPGMGDGGLLGLLESTIGPALPGSTVLVGTATVGNGTTSEVVSVGDEYDGAAVFLTAQESLGTAAKYWGSVASGNLTITVDADPGADVDFAYMIVVA